MFYKHLLFLFVHEDRTQMLEITHTYTPQTTTNALRMEQSLMMVLTLNCNITKVLLIVQKRRCILQNKLYPKIEATLILPYSVSMSTIN